jgi:hypothetical protein
MTTQSEAILHKALDRMEAEEAKVEKPRPAIIIAHWGSPRIKSLDAHAAKLILHLNEECSVATVAKSSIEGIAPGSKITLRKERR